MGVGAHTPGPWMVNEDEPGAFNVDGPTQTDGFRGGYRWFSEADARLIAAAPDLLATAREFVAMYDSVIDMVGGVTQARLERARAAIAKAEGQS